MSEWPERTVDSLCLRIGSGGTPRRSETRYYSPATVPWIKSGDLRDSRIETWDESISELGIANSAARIWPKSTVMMAMYGLGTAGRLGIVDTPAACNQAICALVPDPTACDSRWLFYVLMADRERIEQSANGAAQQNLSASAIRQYKYPTPPLVEQQAIAGVLGALDEKIAANTALAVRLVAYTNALFSRRFGWRQLDTPLGNLADVVDCLHSKKPERSSEGRLLMQLNNIRDDGLVDTVPEYRVSEVDYARWSKKFETRPWDLVITNVGRIGAVARVPNGYQVALGRNMTGVRPRDVTESSSFLAAALHSSAVRREIEQRTDAGSVMGALNVRSIPLIRLQSSTADERRSFHEIASSIFESADFALRENRTLAATRDALLPQLMSGKLRVRDAEAAASAAGV